MLLFFDDEAPYAARLAAATGRRASAVARHRFPDGELKLTLPLPLPAAVVVLRSLNRPNEKLVELVLLAETARALGVRRLTLVAPYLAYMRQDRAFHPGESVSQLIVGRLLAQRFDVVVTVDPHLHRIDRLEDAVPAERAIALTAAPLIGAFFSTRTPRPLLLGPDAESARWVTSAAGATLEHAVCSKRRGSDREVHVELPDRDFSGRDVVLIDDVASTGTTLATCARKVLAAGARRVSAAVTHALLDADARGRLAAAGIGELVSTDAVPHPSNRIALAELIAGALE